MCAQAVGDVLYGLNGQQGTKAVDFVLRALALKIACLACRVCAVWPQLTKGHGGPFAAGVDGACTKDRVV